MKTIIKSLNFLSLISIVILFGSWNTRQSSEKTEKIQTCTNDIFAQNNTSVTVNFVKFQSSTQTRTFNNIAAGGSNSNNLSGPTGAGDFTITVQMPANPGTGRIRVFRASGGGPVLISCIQFTNSSSVTNYSLPDDYDICTGSYSVYVEARTCL